MSGTLQLCSGGELNLVPCQSQLRRIQHFSTLYQSQFISFSPKMPLTACCVGAAWNDEFAWQIRTMTVSGNQTPDPWISSRPNYSAVYPHTWYKKQIWRLGGLADKFYWFVCTGHDGVCIMVHNDAAVVTIIDDIQLWYGCDTSVANTDGSIRASNSIQAGRQTGRFLYNRCDFVSNSISLILSSSE